MTEDTKFRSRYLNRGQVVEMVSIYIEWLNYSVGNGIVILVGLGIDGLSHSRLVSTMPIAFLLIQKLGLVLYCLLRNGSNWLLGVSLLSKGPLANLHLRKYCLKPLNHSVNAVVLNAPRPRPQSPLVRSLYILKNHR